MNPPQLDTQLLHLIGEYLHAHVGVALEVLHRTETFLFVVGDESDAACLRCFDEANAGVMATRADAEDVNSLAALELLPHRGDALPCVGARRRTQPHPVHPPGVPADTSPQTRRRLAAGNAGRCWQYGWTCETRQVTGDQGPVDPRPMQQNRRTIAGLAHGPARKEVARKEVALRQALSEGLEASARAFCPQAIMTAMERNAACLP